MRAPTERKSVGALSYHRDRLLLGCVNGALSASMEVWLHRALRRCKNRRLAHSNHSRVSHPRPQRRVLPLPRRLAAHLPTCCWQDASVRLVTPGNGRLRPFAGTLHRVAPSRTTTHGSSPPPDVCKASIIGSTPIAASNNFPASGDFGSCAVAHSISESAILPTNCRRDSPS
jgi:hypothetical protein